MEMNLEQLEQAVIQWADDKGILAKATPLTQFGKTKEEVEEFGLALEAQEKGWETFINGKGKRVETKDEIEDGIGDATVTLIIGAKMQGLTLQQCLQSAYDVISKRTGKMIDGKFIKSEDLEG